MVVPILKRIGIGIVAATLLVVLVGLFLPRTWTVSRTEVIAAPQERIHALCEDLEQWPAWTPLFSAGPGVEVTMGPVTRGEGAHQSWQGDGTGGELTITRSDPDWGVAFNVAFLDRSTRASSALTYGTAPGGIAVTWDVTGDSGWNVMERYLGLLMDPALGPMFGDGLTQLKLVAEDKAPDAAEAAAAAVDSGR
ncbi:MAG: SRPBCC family protein [Candidatus Krumholzibacteriia bacterium]